MSTVRALPRTVPLKCRSGAVNERFKNLPNTAGSLWSHLCPSQLLHLRAPLICWSGLPMRLHPPRSDPGAETNRLRNIPARVSLHHALVSKIVTCLLSLANVTSKYWWGRTAYLNKARNWSRRGRTCGRISLRQYDLCRPARRR